jgi:hypothetical protein
VHLGGGDEALAQRVGVAERFEVVGLGGRAAGSVALVLPLQRFRRTCTQ